MKGFDMHKRTAFLILGMAMAVGLAWPVARVAGQAQPAKKKWARCRPRWWTIFGHWMEQVMLMSPLTCTL